MSMDGDDSIPFVIAFYEENLYLIVDFNRRMVYAKQYSLGNVFAVN